MLTPVWVAGADLVDPLRHGPRFRAVGIGGVIAVIVMQFVLGGKAYYSGGAYTFLLAAGCVPLGRWLHAKAGRAAAAAGVMVTAAVVALPIAVPVLPAAALRTVPLQKINYDLAESIAWPKQVALVARSTERCRPICARTERPGRQLRRGRRDRQVRRRRSGCRSRSAAPTTSGCGARRPAGDRSAIAINVDPALLRARSPTVRLVAVFRNGLGVSDDEQGATIYVATGLRGSWAQAWPLLRDFS